MSSRKRNRMTGTASSASRSDRPFNLVDAEREQSPGGIAHETGELHRLLVESVQDYAIFALDTEGFILSWNAGAQRFKGYTADEIIGKHFSIFYPAEKVAEHFPEFELEQAALTGRFEDEGWRIRKDGSQFWANVVITALRDRDGTLVGYAKVTRDLTERRNAEEALRLSEERFRLLVQSVKDYAIFMLDPSGEIATWNEGAQRIKGYTAGEILGKHFSVFYPPARVAEGFPDYELKEAIRTGRFEDEGWRVRKDGTQFWANVVITALRDSHGRLVGFGKVTRDLTERREAEAQAIENARRVAAEEAAREASDVARDRVERLQTLTSALSAAHTIPEITKVIFREGFSEFGADGGALAVVNAADGLVHILGGSGLGELPESLQRFDRNAELPVCEVIRTGRTLSMSTRSERDARFPALAKVLAPYESMIILPLGSRGRVIGALSMHRRLADVPTQDSIAFMESFAQQCGQALERAQLYEAEQTARREAEEARARADEANRAKSEFLAAMSHELRTPLNAIGGYAELIELGLRGPVTVDQHEDLRRIQRSQQHLLGIINDLLNFSRIDAGQMEYQLESVSLQEVLESVAHMIAPQATAKGLRFTLTSCPKDALAWADRSKTEQILLNLLSNAVKFTPRGGEVTLCCGRIDDIGVELEVRDTGVGIPRDQLNRIFEPFIQVGRSLTSTREGTGLGLAISRELARAMQGEVHVESEVGVGSIFTVTLPRAQDPGKSHSEEQSA